MQTTISFADSEAFYNQLLEIEGRGEEYTIETGISEAKNLPLRLLHHVGLSKDDIAHLQHKVVEESDFMLDFVEPMVVKFNEMIGKYKPARAYEFSAQADDYDTIKIHARSQQAPSA
jgi:hypothetical protein